MKWMDGRWSACVVFLLLLGLTAALQVRVGAYACERAEHPDEAAHFVTAAMIGDYLRLGLGENPVQFAERYYVRYPKVALGNWPPLFHTVLGAWMLATGFSAASALALEALMVAGTGLLLFLFLRGPAGPFVAAIGAVSFTILPLTQLASQRVMAEAPLGLALAWLALRMTQYLRAGAARDAYWVGAAVAACCLVKGNGAAALAIVPLAAVCAGRPRLAVARPLLTAMGVAIAVAAPFLWIEHALIRRGHVIDWNAARAISAYGADLAATLGPVLPVIAAWPILQRLRGRPLSPEAAVCLSAAIALFLLHVLVPHPLERRHMYTVSLFVLALAALAATGLGRYKTLLIILVLAASLWQAGAWRSRLQQYAGPYSEVVRRLRAGEHARGLRALAVSGSRGEGVLIMNLLSTNPRRNDVVVRGSKYLSESDWPGERYRLQTADAGALLNRMEEHGIRRIILDLGSRTPEAEAALISELAARWPARVRPVAEVKGHHPFDPRVVTIYELTQAADPPRKRLRYEMPYTLGRAIEE